MTVETLFTHCLKSSRGLESNAVKVLASGFLNDRTVAVVDSDNKVITGREFPKLMSITSSIADGNLKLSDESDETRLFKLPDSCKQTIPIKLFRNETQGITFEARASNYISKILNGEFRLVYLADNFRAVSPKRGGLDGEIIGYPDSAPVHLINQSTLDYLNSKLSDKVSVRNFRPNLVIQGMQAFEEDAWEIIQINDCKFRVQERTQRCIFTAIDPKTYEKDEQLMPLTEIAKLRRAKGERPTFGINLVPLNEGSIKVGNAINIISKRSNII